LASSRNVKLLLEPLNWRRHPGYFYHDVAELADILTWIAHPWLKIQFDTFHVGMQSRNVSEVMTRHWPLIGHIQVAAVPDRGEPNCGDVDIAEILHEAEMLGYSGWIGCEYLPRGDVESGLNWMQASGFGSTGLSPSPSAF
jgi:hydroxypyruvate isomerase